jgi:ketosteroid isomerase-like protein
MKTISICTVAVALCGGPAFARPEDGILEELLAIEHGAMDGWLKGDPDKFLSTLDAEITYFHVMTRKRLEGLAAVKTLCEQYRGRPLFDSYEITEPMVQVTGDVAVLTYQFSTRNGAATAHWNATQVYKRKKEGWRVIHTHWSTTQPPPAQPAR